MLEKTTYHKLLRIFLLVGTFALVFQSGIASETTARLADNTELYLANVVGVTVGVKPTELNQITAELTEQRQQLDARESLVREREIAVGLGTATGGNDRTTFMLSIMVFFLLCLIILNYALDFGRLIKITKATKSPISGFSKS